MAYKKKKTNSFIEALHTAGDLGANVTIGAGKGVEGIVDLFAGLGGAVAGIFSDEAERAVKDFVARDLTGDLYGNAWQEGLDQSALNGSKAGEIIEGIAQGVGQLLPAVAVSVATAGTATALGAAVDVAAKAGQAAALGTTIASAAGTGTESAFQDGAGYGQGLAYGAATGAVEGVTEKLTGGLGGLYGKGAKVFGKGARAAAKVGKEVAEEVVETGVKEVAQAGLKEAAKAGLKATAGQIGKETADVGLKRVAKSALGEGVEEMLSEVAAPATKAIYKGKEAFEEYGEADFWGGVLEAGVIGAGTDLAYGGTVGRALKTTGVYGDARSVAEHIEEQKKQRGKAGLSQADQVQIERNIKADQELLSGRLQKLSEKKRAKVFEKMPTFKAMFEADGTIKAEQVAALDANIKSAGDITYGPDIRSSTASAERITEALKNGSTKTHEMRAFTGEMSEAQSKNADGVREFMGAVSERSGGVVGDYVIAEKAPKGPAYFDKKTGLTVIGMDAVENGTALEAVTRELEKAGWQEAVVHETFHAIEDTNAGKELAKLVTDDTNLHNLAIKDVLGRGYLQDFFGKDGKKADAKTVADGVAKLIAKENNGEVLTEQERKALNEYKSEVGAFANQRLLGNKAFVKKLITTEPSTAEKLIAKIREMREDLKVRKDPEAKAQLELVRKAEKLFMQGLSEAGGTIDATGKIHLANREEDEERGKVRRLANPKSVDNLTEEQYNNFGWVRANDVLNSGEWKDFTSKFADAVTGKVHTPITKGGEYMIAVSDIDDALHYGIDNIIVYAKGSIESPQVSRVLEIDLDNETDLDRERRKIYVTARRGLQPPSGGVFRFYASTDFGRGLYEQGKRHQEWQNNGQLGADRGGGRKTTDRIKEFKVNDDGSFTTTYADGRTVTEPPKVRRSRNVTGEAVQLSAGEMAKLHANYAGDKVFAKGAVTEALKGIDALKVLSAERRREIANEIWTGYNKRLHQQGFELFTELAWHQMHAEILQETGFEMSEDEIRVMDEQIVNALHQIVASGKPSIKAKLENDTSTEGYRKQADFWRGEHSKAVQRNKQLNSLKFELEKLANQKKGLYVNAANFRGDSFKVAIDELAKMNWRGGLVSDTKIREHFAKLAAWYTKENPLYKGDGGTGSLFRQEIADTLNALGNSQNGALTVEDLQAAETVVKYFAHEIEAHNTVFKDGKRVDAMPEAKGYIEKVRRAGEIAAKCGMWSNLMRSKFARMVADPAMLMRQADGYLNGFFTEQYEALRQGTIDAAVLERELSEEFEQFWEKNKAYAKRYNDATVKFGDTEMPLQEAISLYMTMKREHAFAGLAGAGFEIDGKKATENISDGFAEEVNRQLAEDWKALPPEELLTLTKRKNAEMEQAALKKVVEQKRQALYDQFTDEDRALIALMERAFEKCRDVKVKIDEIVQGYSNVTGGYYYPIKRTGLAENVDAYTGFEGDRVTNLSMNKETVKNAHKLLIEPAHIVFMRHLKATSLYHGLGVFTDNFNRLYNLNIGSNANNPITVRTALGQSNKFAQEMIKYFKELKQDVEGISKKRSQERAYNDAVAFIRSSYATYQLGANPKVWVTQLSSLVAATNILDADSLTKGLTVSGKDVDEHCRLAWLRNNDGSAVQAQAVGASQNAVQRAGRNVLQKVRDVAMLPIGKVDRLVITRLFGACQVQVEKNGGAKVGTKENKIEAGKLLQRVILETQQNSLATERSAAMRSSDELLKGFTMFSADAMKVGARFVDAFGELSVLRTLRKEANKAGDSKGAARLDTEIKRAKKQCVRATVSLVGVALFNAALAYAFKWLYRRDEDEDLGTFIADTFGNMLGGIPFVRDLWSFFQDGFEMDHFLISTVNDVLGTTAATFEMVSDAASGKEVTRQEALAHMRKVLYAAGQLSGVPTRNIYNVTTGAINRVSPEAGYKVEGAFTKKPFASDLKKALEAGDDKMAGAIAGLMIGEKIGIEDDAVRDVLQRLTEKGHAVLPRSVGDSVTVDGETVTLTGAQQKKLRSVYAIGQEAVADMVKLKQFGEAEETVQAAAIKFVYDVYWDLALEDTLGLDLAEKNVLFAEAIDIEKLAIIIATARAIEADKDENGKAIPGTRKRKLQAFVNSLHLTAAEKYMVMGYLGYSNINGESAVKAHISKLNLSKSEKEKLLKYSGYGGK